MFNIRNLVSSFRPIVSTALRSVEPQVKALLSRIAGDGFQNIMSRVGQLASTLPNPLGSFAQNILGQVAPQLGNLLPAAIDRLVTSLFSRVAPRDVSNGTSTGSAASGGGTVVAPPAFADRGSPTNAAAVSGATGSTTSAATGVGSTSSAATATTGGDFESGLLSKISGPPPMPANVKDERQMLEYQRAMQLYTAMVQMITQVMQMLHEARKNIIQNLRA